jgi:hypothetical protein
MSETNETTRPIGYLETTNADGQVEKSSKRLIGTISFAVGGLLLGALGVVSFFMIAADPGTIQAVGQAFLITGASLLGIGVLEGIGGKR